MSVTRYPLGQSVVLAENLESGDTVTVAIWNKATGASVSLAANSATEIGSTGIYRYTVNMTSPPTIGFNTYIYRFTGTLQTRDGEFDWNWVPENYEGKVYIDTVNGTASTAYPVGTATQPTNSLANALTIASSLPGTVEEFVLVNGSFTLASNFDDWVIRGVHPAKCTVNLGNQSVSNTLFEDVKLTGTQGAGNVFARRVYLDSALSLSGDMYDVTLNTDIQIKNGGSLRVLGGRVIGDATINIDMNGGNAAFNDFEHRTRITNLNVMKACICYGTGVVDIDSTVTTGVVVVGSLIKVTNSGGTPSVYINNTTHRLVWEELLADLTVAASTGFAANQIGTAVSLDGGAAKIGAMLAKLADDSGGSSYDATTDSLAALSTTASSSVYLDGIWVDTVNGSAGTTPYVNGVPDNPVDTWADALTLAAALSIYKFRIGTGSSITLTANSTNYQIIGKEYTLALGGQNITNAYIEGATITGTGSGSGTKFADCKIGTVSLSTCIMDNCGFLGPITITAAGVYIGNNCYNEETYGGWPIIDWGAAVGNTEIRLQNYNGPLVNSNMGADGADQLYMTGSGYVEFDSSCINGYADLAGEFVLLDSSTGIGITFSDDARITKSEIADANWDEALSGHTTAGSMGYNQNLIDDILVDTNEIQGKLPDNNIMGSSVTTDKDIVIDSIQVDTNDIQNRLPASLISGKMDSRVEFMANDVITANALSTGAVNEIRDSILSDSTPFNGANIATIQSNTATTASRVDQNLSTTESNIRGSDNDDLKDISDQLDGIQAAYLVKQNYAYDISGDLLTGNVWVESDGAIVTTATAVSVTFYDEDGSSLFTITDSSPDAQGIFKVEKATPGFTSGTPVYSKATVTLASGSVNSAKGSFVVGN